MSPDISLQDSNNIFKQKKHTNAVRTVFTCSTKTPTSADKTPRH